jgi:RNA recognition motif-containing protein
MCRPDPCGSGMSSIGWTKASLLTFFKKWVSFKYNIFFHHPILANVKNLKIIRDKLKQTNLGYGFVEFDTPEIAKEVLDTLNGRQIKDTNR